MHTVSLNMVKPSPNPVRKTWDEEKMEELAASIKERGVIVPIKVRPALAVEPCHWHGLNILDSEAQEGTYSWECDYCNAIHNWVYVDPASEYDDPEEDEDGRWTVVNPAFEIVYGHRRAEAARRAGLVEIPAIIDEPDDTDALIQALIENIQREDMNPVDEAIAMRFILEEEGWTQSELARRIAKKVAHVNFRLALLDETPETLELVGRAPLGRKPNLFDEETATIGEWHIRAIRGSGIQDAKERESIAVKAVETKLTAAETRAVADAYKAADTPELKDAVLKTSGKLGDADAILRTAKIRIGADPISRYQEEDKRQAFEDYDQAVKDFLDAMKLFDRMLKTAKQAAKFGKFSPEGASFAARRIDALIDELEQLKGELSHE